MTRDEFAAMQEEAMAEQLNGSVDETQEWQQEEMAEGMARVHPHVQECLARTAEGGPAPCGDMSSAAMVSLCMENTTKSHNFRRNLDILRSRSSTRTSRAS